MGSCKDLKSLRPRTFQELSDDEGKEHGMVTFASISLLLFLTVSIMVCASISANASSGLKETITSDGVWRIRRRERSTVIEVIKNEESGHGDIISPEFVEWRLGREANEADVAAKQARVTDSTKQESS